MRSFRFRMQKILEIREYNETQAEIRLGEKTAECQRLRDRIMECDSESAAMLQGGVGTLDMDALRVGEEYRFRLARVKADSERMLKVKEKEREEARQAFLEAQKERKVLSKLREKQAAEFLQEEMKNEEKELEEVSQGFFRRNRTEGG